MLENKISVKCTASKEKMSQAFLGSPVFPPPVQTLVANSDVSGGSIKVDDHGLAIRFVSKGKNAGLTHGFVVGLIAWRTIPRFGESTNDAEISACRANGKAIQTAVALYRLKEGKAPKTMADLTTPQKNNRNRTYLPRAPKCPAGGLYDLKGKCTKHR